MTDSPIKSWIEERRGIHNEATEGPWVAEYSGETGDCVIPSDAQSTREAVAVTRLFHRTADANAIADAHNMFPRALNALEQVLELHGPSEYGCISECREPNGDLVWPCATVRAVQGAIEGAINE